MSNETLFINQDQFSGVVEESDWEDWIYETLAERKLYILSASSVSFKHERTLVQTFDLPKIESA